VKAKITAPAAIVSRKIRRSNDQAATRYIREAHSYTLVEAAKVTGVNRATVRTWTRQGLPILDGGRPILIYGAVLKGWLRERAAARKCPCLENELPCFKCHQARVPEIGTVTLDLRTPVVLNIVAPCPVCGTKMHKGASMKRLARINEVFGIEMGREGNLIGSRWLPTGMHFEVGASDAQR
jgi:hypothetical protein